MTHDEFEEKLNQIRRGFPDQTEQDMDDLIIGLRLLTELSAKDASLRKIHSTLEESVQSINSLAELQKQVADTKQGERHKDLIGGLSELRDGITSGLQALFDKDLVIPDNSDELISIREAIQRQKLDPKIQVKPADVDINLDDVTEGLNGVIEAVKNIPQVDVPETDLSTIESQLSQANRYLKELASRPVVLPNSAKGGTSSGGGGDGAIVDGSDSGIKASVLNYTNSNPLSVRLSDTNGDYVSVGGGTQYTEDAAAPGNPVGNMLMGRRRDTLSSEVSADGDNIALNSTSKGELYVKQSDAIAVTDNGGSLTVDGTITAELSATDNAVLDSIDSTLSDIDAGKLEEATFTNRIGEVSATPTSNTVMHRLKTIADNQLADGHNVTIDNASIPVTDNGGSLTVDGSVSVNNFPASQTVDGTVTANLSATDNAVLDDIAANQTDASQKTQIVDGVGNVIGATANALDVNIASGSSSGTEYTEGDTDASITGTAIMWEDSADTLRAVSAAKPLPIDITNTSLPITDNGGSLTVDGTVTANLSATDNAVLDSIDAAVNGTLTVDGSGVTQPISAVSLPLPTGAATAANQQTDALTDTELRASDVAVTMDGEVVETKESRSSSASTSSTADTTTSSTLLASNSNRLGATVVNDSSASLYLLLGTGTASATNYTIKLGTDDYYEVPFNYTGRLTGAWASDPGDGAARVTEIT